MTRMPLGQAAGSAFKGGPGCAAQEQVSCSLSSNQHLEGQFAECQASAMGLSNQPGWKRAHQAPVEDRLPTTACPSGECVHSALVQQWVIGGIN